MSGRLAGRRVVVVNWRDLDHSLAGGSEVYAWECARALRAAGAHVEYITAREPGNERRLVRDGIVVRRGGGPFTFYAYAAWRLFRGRRRLDAVIDPECGIPAFAPLVVARQTAVVLLVHHVHQAQFATYFPAPLARLGQWLERVAMPRVYRGRRTIAVSHSTVREMRNELGWPGEITVVENGATLPPTDSVDVAAKETGRLIVMGRLVPHKRVDLVLRAVDAIRGVRPDLRVDVVGKGPDRERLEALAAKLGLEDRVRFHGFVSDERKKELLRRATLQVCASDVEGWGQVVIEAAGYGVPTLARDVPGLRDSVHDGRTGWLVPDAPGDEATVTARLAQYLAVALRDLDDAENRRLIHKAAQEWAAGFSWARMHRQIVDLLAEEISAATDPQPSAHVRGRSER